MFRRLYNDLQWTPARQISELLLSIVFATLVASTFWAFTHQEFIFLRFLLCVLVSMAWALGIGIAFVKWQNRPFKRSFILRFGVLLLVSVELAVMAQLSAQFVFATGHGGIPTHQALRCLLILVAYAVVYMLSYLQAKK